ncbi:unnamed protein product [Peronospora farinosa]|uniref:MCM AAA-lid domain-containing protein n=1 Tax=Peronospora farinosa TaxID=134698 RepID=A0ABN8C2V5_9STRA|nr:unnamed protein product [Peronospora farinosa]
MKAALLSRFDLVFIMLYGVDEERDRLLSEHVMNSHARGKRRPRKSMRDNNASIPFQIPSRCADEPAVSDYVKAGTSGYQIKPATSGHRMLPHRPVQNASKLSTNAISLYFKYLKLRLAGEGQSPMDGIPITTRHLESLIYLSQARAQAELAETVSSEHAQDVGDIMQDCLLDMYVTEDGTLDFDRNGGMSLAKKVKIYYSFSFLSYINKSG